MQAVSFNFYTKRKCYTTTTAKALCYGCMNTFFSSFLTSMCCCCWEGQGYNTFSYSQYFSVNFPQQFISFTFSTVIKFNNWLSCIEILIFVEYHYTERENRFHRHLNMLKNIFPWLPTVVKIMIPHIVEKCPWIKKRRKKVRSLYHG